jgi:O-antigen/teichoic acid export membrane protein
VKAQGLSRDIAGIFGTRAVWSAMGVVSGVILARWLGPHDRGILALVLLLPSTVVTITKLGVSQANVYYINREKVAVDRVASNAVLLALILGVLSAAAVWALRDNLLATVLRDVPDWALELALVRVPLLLLDNYLYSILQATGRFSVYNVRLLMSEALRLALVALALIVFDLGLSAAVAIYTLVGFINVSWLFFAMRREVHFSLSLDLSLLRSVLAFGARSWVQTLTAHLLLRVDIYMVAYFLGPAETAFYALALHFTELVLEIPQAVGLVLYPRLASLPEEQIHAYTGQACRRTLMVTVPFALLLAVLGPTVITFWYGRPYAPAGAPLPWAALGVTMMAVFVIVTRDFTSRGKQRINIAAGLFALIANVVLNVLLIPSYGIVGAALATAISYTGACVLLVAFFIAESKLPLRALAIPDAEDLAYFASVARRSLERVRR